jgi:GNAT superfamily N-acetyltransferase
VRRRAVPRRETRSRLRPHPRDGCDVTGPRPARRRRLAAGPRPTLRLAHADDLPACTHVWRRALAEYLLRLNQPDVLTDLDPIRRLLAHLLSTDPARFWVATRPAASGRGSPRAETIGHDGERVVGFASANVRGTAWFLAMLFVDPPEQGRGLGAALFEQTLPPGRRPAAGPASRGTDGWTFGTATDSVQPISNALYARLGLVPRVPMLHLAGEVRRPSAFPPLPDGMDGIRFDALVDAPGADPDVESRLAAAIADVDRELLGYAHPEDHAYLARESRIGVLYRDRAGYVAGYGYTSRVGRVGPVAALDRALLPALLGHLLGVVRPAGAFSTWVPGAAGDVVSASLAAGLRLEPFPALHCWDRPSVDDTRYIPITLALL